MVIELLTEEGHSEQNEGLQKALRELFSYFIGTGQFNYLTSLHGEVSRAGSDASSNELSEVLSSREFLEEVLAALNIWGKEKFDEITVLIRKVGHPFIEPLIMQLALEKNMSLRRYCSDRLVEMGDAIREPLMLQLRDSRWYVVRNLVSLLRHLNDPVTLHGIRSLVNHPHPQVRLEVFKALRQFNDPEANQYLAQELASNERPRQWAALKQLDGSDSPQLLDSLLLLLEIKDNSQDGFALKNAVVDALGKIANPEALPVLERLLQNRSLLHGGQWQRLKQRILSTFRRYPKKEVSEILELLLSSGGALGEQASVLLKALQRGKS